MADTDVSVLLSRVAAGDSDAARRLLPLVYSQLRATAQRAMSGERRDHTLQATALVHEAYLKLVGARGVEWKSRAHFYGAAARAMRQILVDHARARKSAKRGGDHQRVPLRDLGAAFDARPEDVFALDDALSRLESDDLRELGRCAMADDPPTCAAFSPDGQRLAVGTSGGAVIVMDPSRAALSPPLAMFPAEVTSLCWSPDGSRLVVAAGGSIWFVDPLTGDALVTSNVLANRALAFTPDSSSLLAVSHAGGTWLETGWPGDATLLERDRVGLAMEWLRRERPWRVSSEQARRRLERDTAHSPAVRETALKMLTTLREQPAQANNHALLTLLSAQRREQANLIQALESLDAAIAQCPTAPNFRLTRSALLRQLGRYDEALAAIEEGRALYAAAGIRRVPLLDSRIAAVLHAQGRTGEAQERLDSARATVAAEPDPDRKSVLQRDLDDALRDMTDD